MRFHVIHPITRCHVFLSEDPRQEGFEGDVQENVVLSKQPGRDDWPDGAPRPNRNLCLGQSPTNPSEYEEFRSQQDCLEAGFTPLIGGCLVKTRWSCVPGHDII